MLSGRQQSALRKGNQASSKFAPFRAVSHRCNLRQSQVVRAAGVPREADVVVVGAGIAGLSCAVELQQKYGLTPVVLEALDTVGGRVQTDVVDGFLLDRGFQIFLTGYPEAQAFLDYDALKLKTFYAGALVYKDGQFHRVADPFRHLVDGLLSLPNPVGTVTDKLRVGLLRLKTLVGSLDDILTRPETTILERLKAEGFSDAIIKLFFRPFMGGIFFDRNLGTSSRLLEFVMRMLATGDNCLPEKGIGEVAAQLARRLPADSVHVGTKVEKVTGKDVTLADGSVLRAKRGVVVAVQGPESKRLLGDKIDLAPSKSAPGVGTCCLYFKAPKAPRDENILYLNGEDDGGIVNNACFPSTVSPSYAPAGQALVSASTVGTYDNLSDTELEAQVRKHLAKWFGADQVATWTHLRTYRIPFAQPNQAPPTDFKRPVALGDGVFVCGDHRDSATLDGAIKSGRRAAAALATSA